MSRTGCLSIGGHDGRAIESERHSVRSVGEGSALWRVRVELFAGDDPARLFAACALSLERLLGPDDGQALPGIGADYGLDQGIGDAARPVVGFLFWVRADALGQAAERAVDTARLAGHNHGVGPRLYKVTVLPADAVVRPNDPLYPDAET